VNWKKSDWIMVMTASCELKSIALQSAEQMGQRMASGGVQKFEEALS